MIWRKVLRIAIVVILSMALAYLTELSMSHYPATPGEYVAQREVPVPPPPNEFSTLGEKILFAFAVDSACYLVLILGVSAIVRGSRGKAGN